MQEVQTQVQETAPAAKRGRGRPALTVEQKAAREQAKVDAKVARKAARQAEKAAAKAAK